MKSLLTVAIAVATAVSALGGPASSADDETARVDVPTASAPASVGLIAYSGTDRATRRTVIFTIRTDGSHRRQLTETPGYAPAWAPDGARIAYLRRNGDIWLMDATGADPQPTGARAVDFRAPAWAPDGQRFSYVCDDVGSLCMYDLRTRERTVVVAPTDEWPAAQSPSWSADGTRIVFARVSSEGGDYTSYRQLFLVDPDGSHLVPVPDTDTLADGPAWSPDGQTIVYTERYDGRGGGDGTLYSIRPDGTSRARLTGDRRTADNAAWATDGRRLAIDSAGVYQPYSGGIWTTAPDGSDARLLVRDGSGASWRPGFSAPASAGPTRPRAHARRIAYLAASDEGYDIYTVRADGTGRRRLTTDGLAAAPTWSPTHTRIAYSGSTRRGRALWVVNARSGARRRVASLGYETDGLAWSPSGRRIAVVGASALVVIDVRSGERRRIPLNESAIVDGAPTWSPDGRRLVFSQEFLSGAVDLMVVAAGGGTPHRLMRLTGSELEPAWGPSGRIAFTQERGPWWDTRTRVVSVTAGGSDLRVVRNTGDVDHAPAWSPNGTRVALYSDGPSPFGASPRPGLWTVGPGGSHPQWIVRDKSITGIDW